MKFLLILVMLALGAQPAHAIVGGADAPAALSAQTVMIVSTRGATCSGAVIARDLVLTAGHCVQPAANYAVVVSEGGTQSLIELARTVLHPRFDPVLFAARKPSPDLAIVKLAKPLPAQFRAAKLEREPAKPQPGERYTLAGFGVSAESDGSSAGKVRSIVLPVIGNTIDSTGIIMTRLSSKSGKPAGACIGDSGGPVFRNDRLAGIIAWTTGTGPRECGDVTGATLVAQQFGWIAATVKLLGAQLSE
jgi:secreted trypsin-like serine protease